MHFWVLPDWMGCGIGRGMFLHAVERARAQGFREFQIESDPNAEGFYRHLGAQAVGMNSYEIDRHRRDLPVLIYEIATAA